MAMQRTLRLNTILLISLFALSCGQATYGDGAETVVVVPPLTAEIIAPSAAEIDAKVQQSCHDLVADGSLRVVGDKIYVKRQSNLVVLGIVAGLLGLGSATFAVGAMTSRDGFGGFMLGFMALILGAGGAAIVGTELYDADRCPYPLMLDSEGVAYRGKKVLWADVKRLTPVVLGLYDQFGGSMGEHAALNVYTSLDQVQEELAIPMKDLRLASKPKMAVDRLIQLIKLVRGI